MQESIIELRAVLEGTKPSVYRTIQIPSNMTFHDLHRVLQEAFNWYGGHPFTLL